MLPPPGEVVAQAETRNAIVNQQAKDPQTSRFTWRIENFSKLNKKKLYSENFVVDGYKWRILIFPKGNNVDYLSMYLDIADSASLPYGWRIHAQFSLALVNQFHNKYTVRKYAQHEFKSEESDWGFTSFIPLGELYDPGRDYIVNDTCIVEADVAVHSAGDEKDVAEHVTEKLKGKQEEKEINKKEKADADLYTIIKVARNEDLVEQIGRDIYFDLVDHDKVRSFCIQNQMPFNVVKEEVSKEFGIPVQFQRFWLWRKRQNHTYRPYRPLTHLEETQTLMEVSNKFHTAELMLFLEVELGQDLQPIPPPDKTKDDILLFFKLYDPEKEELRYVGRLLVNAMGKPTEILRKLNEMAGYASDEEVDLYEEINFEPHVMCEPIGKKFPFRMSQLEDGDIVCFQKSLPVENGAKFRYPDVPSFLEYVSNLQVATTAKSPQPISDADIEATYSQAEAIAKSITNASSSSTSLSSLDEATKQEVLHFFNLIELPFEELASSRSLELVSCITKIQTISANFFTEDQQEQVNEMADQIQARVAQVQHCQKELKDKNDYIASIKGISSSIVDNNLKEAKFKQEEEQLAKEELELREKLERVMKQRVSVRQEREKLYAETKDLLLRGENGDTKIRAATKDVRQTQLKLRSLSNEWDFFREQFARP